MPEINDNETKDEFIIRCMQDAESNSKFPDRDQRLAFCNSKWKDSPADEDSSTPDAPKDKPMHTPEVTGDPIKLSLCPLLKHSSAKMLSLTPVNEHNQQDLIIFQAGRTEYVDGDWAIVDEQSAQEIIDAAHKRGIDMLIDYEHQHSSAEGMYPRAGTILHNTLRFDPNIGLIATVEWTQNALDSIKKKEILYTSPTFYLRESDHRVTSLHSLALTNDPATEKALKIAAKQIVTLTEKKIMDLNAIKAKLTEMGFDVPEDATLESLVDFMMGHMKKDTPQEASKEDIVAASRVGYVKADDYNKLVNEMNAMKAKQVEQESDAFIAECIKSNKLNPNDEAQIKWAKASAIKSLDDFKVFMAGAPAIIQPGKITATSAPAPEKEREAIIIKAKNDWSKMKSDGMVVASMNSYINSQLIVNKEVAMKKEEIAQYCK